MRKVLIAVVVLGALVAAPVFGFLFLLPPRVAGDIATLLSERTGHDVEVGALSWSFRPHLQLVGQHIRVAGTADGDAPLIGIGAFTLDADLRGLLATPRRVRSVHLADHAVHVPRGRKPVDAEGRGGNERRRSSPSDATTGDAPAALDPEPDARTPVVVDRLVAERARLEIASSRPEKPPRVFEIQSLVLGSVALDRPSRSRPA